MGILRNGGPSSCTCDPSKIVEVAAKCTNEIRRVFRVSGGDEMVTPHIDAILNSHRVTAED